MTAFIVGRALCGLFGSGMYIGVMTLIALTTRDHERSTYFGLVGITWGGGTVMGPIIGGALDEAGAWRWAFYLNLIVGGVAAPVYLFLIPSKDPLPGTSYKNRLAPIDILGTTLIAGTLVCLLMAIFFGGTVYAWSSGIIIALFVISGALFVLFVLQQVFAIMTTTQTRLFPLHFLRSPIMVMLAIIAAASASASFTVIYFLPLLYQQAEGQSPLTSGVHLLPFVFFMVSVCVGNGVLLGKYGYYMPWTLFSGIFIIIGSACLITVDQTTPTSKVYGYIILYGIGVGASIQMPFSVAAAKAKPDESGIAIGYCACFQFAGPAVSLSVANSVFLNKATKSLALLFPALSHEAILGALFGINSQLLYESGDVTNPAVRNAIATAMKNVYAVPLSSGALILILSLFMKREKLFGMSQIIGA